MDFPPWRHSSSERARPDPLLQSKAGDPQIKIWAREGPATVRFQGGLVSLEERADVILGESHRLRFDVEGLAAKLGLSVVSVVLRDPSGKPTTGDSQVTILDSRGEHLLALSQNPPPRAAWLVPPGPVVRARLGQQEQVRRDVPAAPRAEVVFDFAAPAKPGGPAKIQVDVKIESPPEGTIVKEDRTTLIGRASSTGPAGALRIALLIDATGSTRRSSGADLDGDGKEETILQAEVAAGRLLLDELEKVEAKSPGTAFEATILRFGTEASVITPLVRLTDPQGVLALRAALDRVASEGTVGDNNDPAGLDEAVKAAHEGP